MTGAHAEIARSASRGALWTLGTTGGARLIALAGLAVLARLLAPAEFGLMAVALVVITYTETIGDLGTGAALIYWPERHAEVAGVTFWISLVTGWCYFAALQLVAPVAAAFFGSPEAEPLLRALAWSFPIKALGNTHDLLLQRDLRFRARALPELVQAASKILLAVPLALAGLGVWSLVWAQLASQAAWTVTLWCVSSWRPRPRASLDLLRPMLEYGRGIVGVNVLAAITHHADIVIVGRLLGATVLGYYLLAYRIPEMTVLLLMRVAGRVLFPALSRLQAAGGAARLRDGYLVSLRWLALLAVPAAVGLVVLAEPVVLTVFGPDWVAAVPILRALAAYAGLRALGSCTGDLLKAMARPGLLAALGVGKAVVLVPSLVLAGRHGAVALAATLATVTAVLTVVNLAIACRLAGIRPSEVLASLRPAVVGSLFLALAAAVPPGLAGPHLPALSLAAGVLLGATCYLVVVHRDDPRLLGHVRGVLSRTARVAAEVAG